MQALLHGRDTFRHLAGQVLAQSYQLIMLIGAA